MSTPAIRITSKKDGFRRAGVTHTGTTTYPPGTFTLEEVHQLQNDPMLVVDFLPEGEALLPPEDKTELAALLEETKAQLAASQAELASAQAALKAAQEEARAAEDAASLAAADAETWRTALAEAEAKAKAEAEAKAKATGKGK